MIAVDKNGLVEFMNPIAQQLTGWSQNSAQGKPFDIVFDIINEYSRQVVESPVQKVFDTEEIVQMANHTIMISKDGLEFAIEDTASPIKDKSDKVIGVVLVFRDFSEKMEKGRQIEYLSYHDQLTGLYNRRFFEEELKRLDTTRNLPISLVFADINGLKTINDAFGHDFGDQLIREVSGGFITECRADDIIARIGGDEFVILLPKTDAYTVQVIVKRIQEKIEQKKIMNINISLSFGCDTKNMEKQSTLNILKNAEDFMYQKKILDRTGRQIEVIHSIIGTLYVKSPQEKTHSIGVGKWCEAIAKAYHLEDDVIAELKIAGELHDIGKIAIDETILNKPDKLSETERVQMEHHPETGYRLLSTSREHYNVAEYVLSHHEQWDGTGYPKNIKGAEIHWGARVIAIAESYEAMTSESFYHKARSSEEAAAEIKRCSGTQFDPVIARGFVEKVLGLAW